MNDHGLRRLYQFAGASSGDDAARPSGRSDACVSPEELLLLARREGDERRRLAILDHVMTCDACQRELDLVRAADRAASQMRHMRTPQGAAGVIRRRWLRPASTLLAAAVAVVAVGVTLQTLQTRGAARMRGSDVVRGSAAREAASIIAPIAPAADARIRIPVTLAWHAAPVARDGYRAYRVEVLDSAGAPVLITEGVRDTTLVVPSRLLAPGRDYSWWVSAALPGGTRRSRLVRFHVAP